MTLKKINKELLDLEEDPVAPFSVGLIDNCFFEWRVTFIGPQGTPYEGGNFSLNIDFPSNYPYNPPKVAFTTRIYHPNVNPNTGKFCLDCALKFVQRVNLGWDFSMTIRQVLKSLFVILHHPFLEGCLLNQEANLNYKTDSVKFNQIASEWTQKYAQ